MTEKPRRITHLVSTGLLSVIVLMFAENSLFNKEAFMDRFVSLGYPSYLIFPLAIVNILGLAAIWWNRSSVLTGWAYAGFSFNFVLAFLAESRAVDGELISSTLALLFLGVSYATQKKQTERRLPTPATP